MTPKEECEGLMDELIGTVEKLLIQDGEFHPFGATLGEDGTIQEVGPTPIGNDGLDSVGRLAVSLKERAVQQPVRAACIVALVAVQRPGTDGSVDAIRMALDHREGYVAHVFFPYELRAPEPNPNQAEPRPELVFGEPFATRGVSFAFGGEKYPSERSPIDSGPVG